MRHSFRCKLPMETEIGEMARKPGDKWDPAGKLWHIRYGQIKGTGLEAHMIPDAKEKTKL